MFLKYVQDLLGDSGGMLQPNNFSSLAQDRSGWRNLVVACSAAEWWWWRHLFLFLSFGCSPGALKSIQYYALNRIGLNGSACNPGLSQFSKSSCYSFPHLSKRCRWSLSIDNIIQMTTESNPLEKKNFYFAELQWTRIAVRIVISLPH